MSLEATATGRETLQPGGSPAGGDGPQLRLTGVSRRFKGVTAVDRIALDVRQGEIFALLGPSGCGKSTTLRMVAGLEKIDEGSITIGGRVLADAATGRHLAPEKRDIAMVFQSYAVWPHMTVSQNVEFPLKMRRMRRAERRERVARILEVTGLSEYTDRPATMLSGGQQQRVALARALVYTPGLLLLDEPLSNLDAKLRVQMRREIRRLNQELGITMLFVTHDQDEALSLADRLAVLNKGVVEQVGTPADLYERPATPFVRDFLGRLVVVEGTATKETGESGSVSVRLDVGGVQVGQVEGAFAAQSITDGQRVGVHLRPEDVEIVPGTGGPPGPNEIAAVVDSAVYLGGGFEYVLDIEGRKVVLMVPRRVSFAGGDRVHIVVAPARAMVWPL